MLLNKIPARSAQTIAFFYLIRQTATKSRHQLTMEGQKSGKSRQDVPSTPLMKRIISVTPRLSPSNGSPRASDTIQRRISPIKLSPVKTPTGRAGLPSPAKRSISEVNQSAIRRAYRTKVSSILADEDATSDDEESQLSKQDLAIADAIIRESRGETGPLYGDDVLLEVDHSEEERTPTGRSLRTRKRTKIVEFDGSDQSDSEAEFSSEDEDDDDISEEEVPDDDDGVFVPSKPFLTKSSGKRKPKVTKEKRPRKSDLELLTVFRQDDVALKSRSPFLSPKKQKTTKKAAPLGDSFFDEDLVEQEEDEIPFISGIPELQKEEDDRKTKLEFSSFPLPSLGRDQALSETFIKQHLPDIKWEATLEEEVLDDRAFYFEGTEGYFDQNSHRERHSVQLLTNLGIKLSHEEFTEKVKLLNNTSIQETTELMDLYKVMYHQWCFELSQGYNICFYGVGSKIEVINDFAANYLVSWIEDFYNLTAETVPKVVVINGYNPSFKLKDIAKLLIETLTDGAFKSNMINIDFYHLLFAHLSKINKKHRVPKLILVVHCLDGEAIRDDTTQSNLCQLASLPEVILLASIDNISAPLLWDPFKVEHYKFLFHDATTYKLYVSETSFKDAINMGKAKKAGNTRGALFVLSALNKNSKIIYKQLLTMQLEKIKGSKSSQAAPRGNLRNAVDFKLLHEKCMEQFVTSNEISFMSMVTEFVEHNMCKITKDEAGTEKIFVPFTVEEMNKLLK